MVAKFLCAIVIASTLVYSNGLYGASIGATKKNDATKKEIKELMKAQGLKSREDLLIVILEEMYYDNNFFFICLDASQEVPPYSLSLHDKKNISLLQGLSGGKIDFVNYGKQIDEKLKNLKERNQDLSEKAREIIYKKSEKLKGN